MIHLFYLCSADSRVLSQGMVETNSKVADCESEERLSFAFNVVETTFAS